MRHHSNFSFESEVFAVLQNLTHKVNHIMATLSDIQAAVAAQTTVEQSMITLLNGIVQQLKDAQASQDPAAMDAVVANIEANTKAMSDAVAANTPVQTSPSQATTPVVQAS